MGFYKTITNTPAVSSKNLGVDTHIYKLRDIHWPRVWSIGIRVHLFLSITVFGRGIELLQSASEGLVRNELVHLDRTMSPAFGRRCWYLFPPRVPRPVGADDRQVFSVV